MKEFLSFVVYASIGAVIGFTLGAVLSALLYQLLKYLGVVI